MFAIVLIYAIFAIAAGPAIEMTLAAALFGAALGYAFRTAIASEISKLALSTIISNLENLAKEDAEKIREEVSSLAASLRKHL